MARYRLSRLAEADLASILAASHRARGAEARRRYAALILAAMRKIAADPESLASRARDELWPGLRSLHLGHAGGFEPADRVRHPVHVLYYRPVAPDVVEILRVLHERMEASRRLADLGDG